VKKHPATKQEQLMMTAERPIEECVVELLGHLGIERAYVAAGSAPTLTDWHGLATRHPECIASLTVVSPPILDGSELAAIACRRWRATRPTPVKARRDRDRPVGRVAAQPAATRRNRGPMSPPTAATNSPPRCLPSSTGTPRRQ
jgi:pimeloyl-ACP methyl ester carboxylesterase